MQRTVVAVRVVIGLSCAVALLAAAVDAGDPSLEKEVDLAYAQADEALAYTITVANGADALISTGLFTDTFPAEVSACSWSCTATGGGWCEAANGAGDIAQLVSVPPGATATFEVTCTFNPSPGAECATNVASFQTMDPDTTASDQATTCQWWVTIFFDGFESGGTDGWSAVTP